jgi:hypothetical protein
LGGLHPRPEGRGFTPCQDKFCFMKKQLPLYKRIVPLRVPIMYALISGMLLALPTILSTGYGCVMFPQNSSIMKTTE